MGGEQEVPSSVSFTMKPALFVQPCIESHYDCNVVFYSL